MDFGKELSHDEKTLITIILIVFAPPAGIIAMYLWMDDWPNWLKYSVVGYFAFLIISSFVGMLLFFNVFTQALFW